MITEEKKNVRKETLSINDLIMPGRVIISLTTGLPIVRVPVLSNTIVFTAENFSKTFPPRSSSPLVAPNEVPT